MEWEIKVKSEWKDSESRYSNGKNLMLGKMRVACVFYDGSVSKGSVNVYALTTSMDGIKAHLGHFLTEEEAKTKAESVLNHWVNKFLKSS
jgi:hypothetical protein